MSAAVLPTAWCCNPTARKALALTLLPEPASGVVALGTRVARTAAMVALVVAVREHVVADHVVVHRVGPVGDELGREVPARAEQRVEREREAEPARARGRGNGA